jgi:hypothetical protein
MVRPCLSLEGNNSAKLDCRAGRVRLAISPRLVSVAIDQCQHRGVERLKQCGVAAIDV